MQITWAGAPGRLDWSITGYHTENQNDIYSVPSMVTGFGYYTNAGNTLREGVDIGATYTTDSLGRLRQLFLHPGDVPDADNAVLAEQSNRRR